MIVDIDKFLGLSDEPRDYLKHPFKVGEYEVRTNGHIMCFLKSGSDIRVCKVNLLEKITDLINKHGEQSFFNAPHIELCEKITCRNCHGSGKLTKNRCEECDGDGEVQLHTDFNTYECECKTCDGDGHIHIGTDGEPQDSEKCHHCLGDGDEYEDEYGRITHELLGGLYIQSRYWDLICHEPDLQIAVDDYYLFFKAGQVSGIFMPCRKP